MNTLRDELASAFDEDASNEAEKETETQASEEASGEVESRANDSPEKGTEATETDGTEEGGKSTEKAGKDTEPSVESKDAEPEDPEAPIDYDPETKELWKAVPSKVKQHIHKREQQMAQAMQGTSEARRTHQSIAKLASDFAPIIAAEGVSNPMEAIAGMFNTVAEIRLGSPQQRATKMAQLIGHYGIDIAMLDSALAGTPQHQETSQMEQMLNQRLGPMQRQLEQYQNMERQQANQSQQAVTNELKEFSKGAEFLQYVRHDMADLIDMASKRGQFMGFKDAYAKACAINPQIAKVMSDRASSEALKNSGRDIAGKKLASSSIRGNSSVKPDGSPIATTLRGMLNEAWDAAD